MQPRFKKNFTRGSRRHPHEPEAERHSLRVRPRFAQPPPDNSRQQHPRFGYPGPFVATGVLLAMLAWLFRRFLKTHPIGKSPA